jgi:dihydroorotate dehydrogenase (fumarate)
MADLRTKYMGLELRNPLVVASCSLTNSLEGLRRCADAGAGAVVLKSIFEEQIRSENEELKPDSWIQWHPEAFEYVSRMSMELGTRPYLKLIEASKRSVTIPVMASLNCISRTWWSEYARHIEEAGADALELNISFMPSDPARSSEEIEKQNLGIVEDVLSLVKIPVAVKMAPYYTSVSRMAAAFAGRGASALVLFNRYYRFDIDPEKLCLAAGYRFSSPEETSLPLRWISLLAGQVPCDLAASTGVHQPDGVIKQLLAGAAVVQLCSTLYLNGLNHIAVVLDQIQNWMGKNAFTSIDDFRGKLSQKSSDRPELFERLQYIKSLVGME